MTDLFGDKSQLGIIIQQDYMMDMIFKPATSSDANKKKKKVWNSDLACGLNFGILVFANHLHAKKTMEHTTGIGNNPKSRIGPLSDQCPAQSSQRSLVQVDVVVLTRASAPACCPSIRWSPPAYRTSDPGSPSAHPGGYAVRKVRHKLE